MLKADNIVSFSQYLIALAITWTLIMVLLFRFFQIQILGHDRYSRKANTNRIRKVTQTAPRGLILDRNGKILVDNYPTYVLTAIPGELWDKDSIFKAITEYIDLDTRIIKTNYKKYYSGRFTPTRLAKDLTFSQISRLEENRLGLEGIYYEQVPERYFPTKVKASHILGYVKEVDRSIKSKLKNENNYALGDRIGWKGLEKRYEQFLNGEQGIYFYEVDAYSRVVGHALELEPKDPIPGQNIVTTLDLDIQYFIENIMKGKKGAIIVGNPGTGEILGAVSAPDYRPNLFTGLMLVTEWETFLDDPDKPLINRLIQGVYPPGSIIKMITASHLLKNPDFDPTSFKYCDGHYQFGNRVFGCWWDTGHGNMDLSTAMLNSCDVYFYKNNKYFNLDELSESLKSFGFGQYTGIDIPGESKGIIPSIKFMNQRYGKSGWSRGALLNICIGQGELSVTPIQVFNYINLLASRGNAGPPHLVMLDDLPSNVRPNLADEHWDQIIENMRKVVSHPNGTGKKAQPDIPGAIIYGKTGTAENPHGENHAWFIGWVDYFSEKYSLVILLENAGSGGVVAAPIAKKIFAHLIQDDNLVLK